MHFRTNDWLKRLNAPMSKPTNPNTFQGPKPPVPTMLPKPASNPMQRITGQVGGNQTTAQQTQPWSALLGGWFNPPQGQQNMQPMEALRSWLQSQTPSFNQGWTPMLPQNITNDLLGRPRRNRR